VLLPEDVLADPGAEPTASQLEPGPREMLVSILSNQSMNDIMRDEYGSCLETRDRPRLLLTKSAIGPLCKRTGFLPRVFPWRFSVIGGYA
jgi:hypothetical protein